MRKYILIFIAVLIMVIGISFGVNADSFFAEVSGDKVLMRNTNSDGSVEIKAVEIYNLGEFRYFGVREMADSCGAEIGWDDSTKTVTIRYNDLLMSLKNSSNEVYINGNRYDFGYPVIIIDGKSYAPLELYKAFTGELELEAYSGSETEAGESVESENGTEADRIRIAGAANKLKHDFMLSDPYRIVLDIADINITDEFKDGSTYEKIRHFKGSDGITRIVFDLKDKYEYRLDYEGSDLIVTISSNGEFTISQNFVEYRNNSIIINTDEYSGYKIYRGTDPYSITASIPGTLVPEGFIIDTEDGLVEKIEVTLKGDRTDITAILSGQCAFELEKLQQAFIIGIYDPVVSGVSYHNNDEGIYVDAGDAVIGSINNRGNEITVEIKKGSANISPGQVYINDDVVKSMYVSESKDGYILKLTLKSEKFASLSVDDQTNKIILGNKDYSGHLVVLSAGHGGSDPGAIVNDVYESHLNLDITNKIKQLLENAGVEVHMIRTDDSFVSLDDRTYTANKMKADLFLSIHCNTLEDTSFDGLMTLVHSGSINYDRINGKTAGTIIHEKVIASTGATDRGVRNRDKIIVLKDTAMPAVEIECGFLTNETEFGKLLDDSYQWSIAEGTAAGVLNVLDLMD